MTKPSLLIQGMHGLGDCLHQRAIVRQLMQTYSVSLETSWASLYADLVGDDLHLVRKPTQLRTQAKNQIREASLFDYRTRRYDKIIRIRYGGDDVRRTASKTVLEAMCHSVGMSYADADYQLPIPETWLHEVEGMAAYGLWRESGKPLCIYRPLVERPEWKGSTARNADPSSYATLFASIREELFVISVADLVPGREWMVGPRLRADVDFHEGQLTFESLAAFFSLAALVFTSSGFAAILGPAVGTPTVNIVGGYEHTEAHDSGKKFAPMFSVGPAKGSCSCWSSQCRTMCDKRINTSAEIPRLREFMSQICIQMQDIKSAGLSDIFDLNYDHGRPTTPATPFGNDARMRQMGLKA